MAFSAEAKWGSVSKRVGAFIAGHPDLFALALEPRAGGGNKKGSHHRGTLCASYVTAIAAAVAASDHPSPSVGAGTARGPSSGRPPACGGAQATGRPVALAKARHRGRLKPVVRI